MELKLGDFVFVLGHGGRNVVFLSVKVATSLNIYMTGFDVALFKAVCDDLAQTLLQASCYLSSSLSVVGPSPSSTARPAPSFFFRISEGFFLILLQGVEGGQADSNLLDGLEMGEGGDGEGDGVSTRD